MNDQQIARLEARLENLVEGLFTHLFGKRVNAHEIALQLVRSMEGTLRPARDGDPRPIAPDQYVIYVHPDVHQRILESYPLLPHVLSEQIIEMAASASYRLMVAPKVTMMSNSGMTPGQLVIQANHMENQHHTTQAMKPIHVNAIHKAPTNPQLILSGTKVIDVDRAMLSIGRSHENDIILDEPSISRFHAQLRLRFGHYVIFDADSAGGTFVNDVRIKEHRLQTGDVIRIGGVSLVYMQDDTLASGDTGILNNI